MTVRPLRIAGVVLLFAVLLIFAGLALSLTAGPVGGSHRLLWVSARLLYVVGCALGLLSLPALYARQYEEIGLPGMIGFGLFFIGFLASQAFIGAVQAFFLPWVYDKGSCTIGCHLLNPDDGPYLLGVFFLIANLFISFGLIVFGIVSARAAVLPRAAGYLLAVAGLLSLILTTVPINVPDLVGQVPQALGLVAVGWMATTLATEGQPPVRAQVTRSGRHLETF
jgi:hypothetical protein